KPNARTFAATVLAIGLILRGLASERAARKKRETTGESAPATPDAATEKPVSAKEIVGEAPLLCAVRGVGKTLSFAIEEAQATRQPLYLLFVREQPALTAEDRQRQWRQDDEAQKIFELAMSRAGGHPVLPCYIVSDSPADTIVDIAATIGASRVILGSPQRSALVNVLRGNLIRRVSKLLPENIHLLVHA
ncbi:MAG: universal stress protein UspA, partial [Verrucomicrobia bacterium]